MKRRSFLKYSTIPLSSAPLFAFGQEDPAKTPNFKNRIYKALKGGKKRGESVEEFFMRLKGLGYAVSYTHLTLPTKRIV